MRGLGPIWRPPLPTKEASPRLHNSHVDGPASTHSEGDPDTWRLLGDRQRGTSGLSCCCPEPLHHHGWPQ